MPIIGNNRIIIVDNTPEVPPFFLHFLPPVVGTIPSPFSFHSLKIILMNYPFALYILLALPLSYLLAIYHPVTYHALRAYLIYYLFSGINLSQ